MLEVLDALIEVYGSNRVGIRLSPTGRYNDMYDSNPLLLMTHALKELEKKNLCFVEIKRDGNLDKDNTIKEGKTTDSEGRVLPKY